MANMRKIRVVQIIKGLDIGGFNGGAERFSIDLAFSLPKEQFDVSICAFFRQGTAIEKCWLERISSNNIPVFFVSDWVGNNRFDTYLRGLINLQKEITGRHVDICHSHFQLGTLAALYLKLLGKTRAAVRTAHLNQDQEWEPGWYGRLRQEIVSKWVYPLFLNSQVGVSQAIVDSLQKHPGVKVSGHTPIRIYNAIALDDLQRQPNKKKHLDQNRKFIIGVIGRLTEQKGHIYLLEALEKVVNHFPEIECWFIGDGHLRGQLEEKCKQLGLEHQVKFLGNRGDVPDLLPQLDLFVLPSLWEGLPTVIMESMAFDIPVLATDIPGTREIINDGYNGWLVQPRDKDQLASKIIHILLNPQESNNIIVNAYQSVQQYSISTVSKQYQDLYRSLIHF